MHEKYKAQVSLLLRILPEISKEDCFALHGGTAINLFVRDMPRLSVDIDLTYLPFEDRNVSLQNINEALERIKVRIESVLHNCKVTHAEEIFKLLISHNGSGVKVEVTPVARGAFGQIQSLELRTTVQEEFNAYCRVNVVSNAQLYGGKICAALDRQHPRDLFDIKYLFESESFNGEIKNGFLLALLGGVRPPHEILNPILKDLQAVFESQFSGMTNTDFSYLEFEETRKELLRRVNESLESKDKDFILSFANGAPDWSIHDFQLFPAVQWKLQNILSLKDKDPLKHQDQLNKLKSLFNLEIE
jgi:predicted nucleotidyltransferase component of viral defense system